MVPGHVSSFLATFSSRERKDKGDVMSQSKIRNKNSKATQVMQLILGIRKHYPDGSQLIPVGGASFTVTALTELMQSFVDQRADVETAKAAVRAKVENERTQAPSKLAVIRAFVTVLRGAYGNSADILADFGLAPLKVATPLTAEEKAVAVARREATRAARHTMGKNQKKAVKGAIKASLVVTPANGSAPGAPTGNPPAGGTTPRA